MSMTVSDIVKQVRWCVDEESGYQDYEDTYFDNIVKSKIGTAVRWCALYADVSMLNDGTSDGLVKTVLLKADSGGIIGKFSLPSDLLRLIRVRAAGWRKAVTRFISEDSDEYLMQQDATCCATADRPVAALIQTSPLQVQPFPGDDSYIEYTYVCWPNLSTADDSTSIPVPFKLESAFVYYLAFLVMSAHSDMDKANAMLAIAKQHLSLTVDE